MKVVHLLTFLTGGAAASCIRYHKGLLKAGVESSLLTEADLVPPERKKAFAYRLKERITWTLQKKYFHTANPIYHTNELYSAVDVNAINALDADLIHLHWTNANFLSIHDIAKIRKPLCWDLSDSWVFCGMEHHPNILEGDKRYRDGYTRANFPASSSGFDMDRWVWLWKRHCWKNTHITFTAPSSWEASCLEESALFKGQKCHVIHYPFDSEVFKPLGQTDFRQKHGIPEDAKVVLFGAMSVKDPNKGFQFLQPALKRLVETHPEMKFHLLTFGKGNLKAEQLPAPCTQLGMVSEEAVLCEMYNASDVYVCPSIAESFSNTTLEATACGIPVCAFDFSGPRDIILHRHYGYLAKSYEPDDLADGIAYCLSSVTPKTAGQRQYAVGKFSIEVIGRQLKDLYSQILNSQK